MVEPETVFESEGVSKRMKINNEVMTQRYGKERSCCGRGNWLMKAVHV